MSALNLHPKETHFDLDSLVVPAYYSILFPLGRDLSKLDAHIERDGFGEEHPLVLRRSKDRRGKLEIVAGVKKFEIARARKVKSLSGVVKALTDAEARVYTARDNLRHTASPLSVVHAIILARDIEAQGGEKYTSAVVLEATGTSGATYQRAVSGLSYAVDTLHKICPDMAGAGLAELVCYAVKNNVWATFTNFYTGKLKPATFKNRHYVGSERAREQRRRQGLEPDAVPTELRHNPAAATIRNKNREIEIAEIFGSTIMFAARVAQHLRMKGETELSPLLLAICRDSPGFAEACELFAMVTKYDKLPRELSVEKAPVVKAKPQRKPRPEPSVKPELEQSSESGQVSLFK